MRRPVSAKTGRLLAMGRLIVRIGLSILAAILTFGTVVILQGLFGKLRFNSLWDTGLWLASMIIFALGVAVMRFVVPSVYAVALGCMIPTTVFMLVALHPGNLAGLAFWASVLPGLVVALAVGIIGSLLHKLTFPGWMPYAFMGCGVIALAGLAAGSRYVTARHAGEITDRLQEIRSAELAYAARDPAHGFTCVPTFQHGELHGGRARALEHSTRTRRPLTATGFISTAKPRRIRDHSLSAHSLPKERDSRYRWTRKDISLGYIRQSDDFRRVDICLKSGPARKISVGPPGDWPRTSFGPEKLNE
jgi:hypothetical protein